MPNFDQEAINYFASQHLKRRLNDYKKRNYVFDTEDIKWLESTIREELKKQEKLKEQISNSKLYVKRLKRFFARATKR